MKFNSVAAAGVLASCAAAFPRIDPQRLAALQRDGAHLPRAPAPEPCPFADKREAEAAAEAGCPFAAKEKAKVKRSTFDAQQQRISTSGIYEWQAPSTDDQRGPCPGLNALANHGYLPRNGVADMATIIKAVNEVYGMSLDLGGFLAVYGTVFDGNPLSTNPGYSIGGPSIYSENILNGGGILGTPSGLSGSHNKYESDVSATRGDLYVTGNNFHVVLERFVEYWNAIPENTPAPQQYTALAPFHKQRFDDSVNTNPYFFYSPFAGVLVSPAAYAFPPRMMANHSDQYPDGYLSREVFTTFFGVNGSQPGNFVVNQGWERIPDNWYKRPIDDEYSIPKFLVDVLEHAAYYPRLLSIGGNLGTTNSFAGVDIGNLTGGVFNLEDLAQGNNLECLTLQIIQAAGPDLIGTMFADASAALAPLTDRLQQLLANEACPQLETINWKLFEPYPGYTESYGSYAGVSKGTLSGLSESVGSIVGGIL